MRRVWLIEMETKAGLLYLLRETEPGQFAFTNNAFDAWHFESQEGAQKYVDSIRLKEQCKVTEHQFG